MNSVLILLSTYNGERYLEEQLDSLYNQEGVDVHILARDDGSKDNTISILKSYQNHLSNMIIIEGENIGVGASFFSLIKEAVDNHKGYDYYAFCDQDDVWFKHKLISGVSALNNSNAALKLFFSSAINTNANLQPLPVSCVRTVNSFGANLVANHILGCTMMFNEKLLIEINKINIIPFSIPNGIIPIHDNWTALVAYSLGADVIQSEDPLMYYRQHSHNVIGSSQGFLSLQKNRIKRFIHNVTHVKANKCIIALQVLNNRIPEKNKQLLDYVATYRDGFSCKIRLLFDKRIYEYGLIDNISTFFVILFEKF